MKKLLLGLVAGCLAAGAQDIKFPASFEQLAKKAAETVDVSLDGAALQLAGGFLSNRNEDESKAKQLIQGLKGIYVRSFEFAKPGEYSQADVDSMRAQIRTPPWSRLVGVRSKEDQEKVDVFAKVEGSHFGGFVILVAEPKQLTVVNIVGNIDPEQLRELGGRFGVPKVDIDKLKKGAAPSTGTPKPNQDE